MASIEGDRDNAEAMNARRKLILATADDLLAEQGLEGLTIRAVLARTGLARRAFYDLFETKDDLVLAVFEHTIAKAVRILAEDPTGMAGPVERLERTIRSIVAPGIYEREHDISRHDRRSAAFSREHLRLSHARPEHLHRAVYPLVDLIRQIIQKGVDLHGWHSENPERSARFVYNLVSTTVHSELLLPGSELRSSAERVFLAEQLTTFCLNAFRHSPSNPPRKKSAGP